jgi:hypothetical protein
MAKIKLFLIFILSTILYSCGSALEDLGDAKVSIAPCAGDFFENKFQGGDGTFLNPYIICTATQFLLINNSSTNLTKHFYINNDLDFSSVSFQPIGFYDHDDKLSKSAFRGTLDGGNKILSGINFEAKEDSHATGLIAYAEDATLRNLVIEDVAIKGNYRSGALLGFGVNTSIENINVSGSLGHTSFSEFGVRLGGVAGELMFTESATIKNISSNTIVSGNDLVAELFGLIVIASDEVTLNMDSLTTIGSVVQSRGGNTLGGAIGMIVMNNIDNSTLNIINSFSSTNVILDKGTGGSWSGAFMGQLQITGAALPSQANFKNILIEGNIKSVANFNVNGSLAGFVGNLLASSSGTRISFEEVGIKSNIQILKHSQSNNYYFGGFAGFLRLGSDIEGSSVSLKNSYFSGEFSSLNSATVNRLGGLFGHIQANPSSTNDSRVIISNVYVDTREDIENLKDAYALIGMYTYGPTVEFSEVFSHSDLSLIGAEGQVDPENLPGVMKLTSPESKQKESYESRLWDFINTWDILETLSTPVLRSHKLLKRGG